MEQFEETLSPTSQDAPQDKNAKHFWKELFKLVIIAIIIVVPFRLFIARPFIVDGSSMYPTFKNGQYLIVDEVTYRFEEPERGDVLIFSYPLDPCVSLIERIRTGGDGQCRKFIKRIIGLPDETVLIQGGKITIKNTANPEGIELDEFYVKLAKEDSGTYTLTENEYFVMGDNRGASADSRMWGPVSREDFIGRPMLRLYPPSVLPGKAIYQSDISLNRP